MALWFVYRSHYEGPLSRRVRKLRASSVLAWFQARMAEARAAVTGAFATPNCRGSEKVRRLQAVFGEEVRLRAAYGDTSGDTEMLAIAEEPGYRVFQEKP